MLCFFFVQNNNFCLHNNRLKNLLQTSDDGTFINTNIEQQNMKYPNNTYYGTCFITIYFLDIIIKSFEHCKQ